MSTENLKKYLEECKAAYYAGSPIITDSQYDALEDIYERVTGKFISVGTNRGKIPHWFPMYSLQKIYWGDKHPFEGINLVSTPKLDGAAIALRYLGGKLNSAITRGDGEYGEDVSHLFKDPRVFESLGIPQYIDTKDALQITGEIVAPVYIENARNYAAGALGLKNEVLFADKILSFFAYGVQPYPTEWYRLDMDTLTEYGFNTVWSDRDWNDYPEDGMVCRVDSNIKYEEMGFTSKHPRGAYAIKERTEGVKTKIVDVIWQTGKTGKVTPVALLDPVNIDGAKVSRVTLNNPGFIEALGVRIEDYVMVERAGGIIPRIIKKAE